MPGTTELKHKFNPDIEQIVTKQIVDWEYSHAKSAQSGDDLEFAQLVDMMELKRNEKDYNWMSDIMPPVLVSFLNTDASTWANQYFQTRDFVEVKLDGFGPYSVERCSAVKKCLNSTLNRRELYHYHKYIRGRLINALKGQVYAICWWEKDIEDITVGYNRRFENLDVDVQGNPITDPENQIPARREIQEPVYGKKIKADHFNYEIVDPRNVFTDSTYCYSIQDKTWVTIRRETTFDRLKQDEKKNNYFNLDIVKDLVRSQRKTETSKATYSEGEEDAEGDHPVTPKFDVLLRFGKLWSIGKKDGTIEPGYDAMGLQLDKAELIETITETVYTSGGAKILIRYEELKYEDSRGKKYRPILRGWCYIHPTKDRGLSSGKNIKEIQTAIADNFNMGMDRVKLATLPVLKADEAYLEEFIDEIYIEPQHVIPVRGEPDKVLTELKISDNIDGMNITNGMLTSWAQQVEAIYPTTMGDIPGKASTTATAVAGGEIRTNLRGNYKSLTWEYTFALDQYSMILNMTWQFAEEETVIKMMGEDAQYFDPVADYSYSPVSSNIEQEYSKTRKIQNYDQTLGRLSGMVKIIPELIPVIAHILRRQLELQGDEYQDVGDMIKKLSGAKPRDEKTGEIIPDMAAAPTSNQTGNAMTSAEIMGRSAQSQGIIR